MLSSLPSLTTIDPEAAALRGLISAIAINCINQNHTSHNDIQSIITQYTERYPTLTVALIEGEIVSQQRPPLNEGGVSAPSKLPAAVSGLVGGASIADQEAVYHHATTANSEQPEHEQLFAQSIAATTTNTTTTTTTTTHNNRKRKSPSTKVTTTNGKQTSIPAAALTNPQEYRWDGKRLRKKWLCNHPSGCKKHAQKGGRCIAHGARILCKVDGCEKWAQKRGVCCTHGASARVKELRKPKPCAHIGCSNQANTRGLCKRHGGVSIPKPCKEAECKEPSCRGGEGYCMEHAVSNGTLKSVSVPQKPASV